MPLYILLVIGFIISCAAQDMILIEIDSNDMIFVDNKKIASIAALKNVLEAKKDISKRVLIQIDPEQGYNMLYKIVAICESSGYADVSINNEPIFLQKRLEIEDTYVSSDSNLYLAVNIDKDFFEIVAHEAFTFTIFHEENLDSTYDDVVKTLISFQNRFFEGSLDNILLRVYAKGDVSISNIIPVIRRARISGFKKIILEPTKEPEIITREEIGSMFRRITYGCKPSDYIRDSSDTTNYRTLFIRVDSNAIFIDNEKIANTIALKNALLSEKEVYKKCHIQIDPYQNKNALVNIMNICNCRGYTDISIASKINEKDYYESIDLVSGCGGLGGCLKKSDLAIAIYGNNEIDIKTNYELLSIKGKRGDYDYDELTKKLVMIKNRFKDSLNADSVFIYADGGVEISHLITTMYKVKISGFPKRHLTYGWPSIMRDFDASFAMSRSRNEIMDVVNLRANGLKSIYSKYLKKKPGFSGKVILKFTIAPSGDITSISVASSTTDFPEFDEAIKNAVAKWKWKATKSSSTTPTIPFNFAE
jgi:TonB family protein